jgi:PAS domain-containing protein
MTDKKNKNDRAISEIQALRLRLKELEKSENKRKKVEKALIETDQRLYSIIEGSPIPAFMIGKDHKIVYWNKALEELSRIKAREVIGTRQQWRAFYSKKRPCMADLLVKSKTEDLPKWYEGKYIKSNLLAEAYEATDFFPELGEKGKWLRFTAAIIRNAAGDLVGAVETL